MKISVIICSYNREKFILTALSSVASQTLSKDKFEIVIVNNNSTDRTGEIARQFITNNPDITARYYDETDQGLSYARNRGIRESRGNVVSFIDDDAIAEPDFLEAAYNYLTQNPDVSCIGGKILLRFDCEKPEWLNKYMASLLGWFDLGDQGGPFKRMNYPRGSNMFFKKDLFEKYGYFDVELGRKGNTLMGAEEKEINQRMRTAEKIMYVPKAVVHHRVPYERTTPEFIKKQAVGIGRSYRQMFYTKGFKGKAKLFFFESCKWIGTIILALRYWLSCKSAKAKMVIRFRKWVLKGIKTKVMVR